MTDKNDKRNMSRRDFLRRMGMGAGAAVAMGMMGPLRMFAQDEKTQVAVGQNRMTYRVQHGSGEQISLLGFGMMRLPREQEEVDRLVDYAIEHGVNYFDTAPMYMGGQSEVLTGNSLSRFPRDKYFVATNVNNRSDVLRWYVYQQKEKLLGAEQKKALVEHLRDENGKVHTTAVMNALKEIEEAIPTVKN